MPEEPQKPHEVTLEEVDGFLNQNFPDISSKL
jgi:hypothetical protein